MITIVEGFFWSFMVLIKQLRQTSAPNSGLISSLGFTLIYNFGCKRHLITLFISLLLDSASVPDIKASLNVTKGRFWLLVWNMKYQQEANPRVVVGHISQ